jgi:hypothetical protein
MDPKNTSDREKRIVTQLESSQRLVCSHLTTVGAEILPPAKYLFIVMFDVPPERVEEFHAWYDTEHLDMLMKVPGWIRARRYKLESFRKLGAAENPREFIAVHEIDSPEAVKTVEFDWACSTPWSKRNIEKGKDRLLVRTFEHRKAFHKST